MNRKKNIFVLKVPFISHMNKRAYHESTHRSRFRENRDICGRMCTPNFDSCRVGINGSCDSWDPSIDCINTRLQVLLPLELPYTLTAAGTLSAIITGSVNNTLTHRQSTLHQSYTTHNQIKAT